MANPFTVQRTEDAGVALLTISGYLDAHTAPQFEKAIQEEYDARRLRILVDCAGLTYISSAGLGVFMSFIEDIREAGGDIKICSTTPGVYQVFEILGFSRTVRDRRRPRGWPGTVQPRAGESGIGWNRWSALSNCTCRRPRRTSR
jgi:anti-sigma B factor antagonist